MVNRVVLDGTKATGVSLTHDGVEYQVSARREIIVSGGTLKSPQILELSGIGDPAILKAAGVECKVANTGVGANLQDHSITLALFEVQPGVVTLDTLAQVPEAMAAAGKQYAEESGGPLSCIASMQGFFPAKKILSETELEEVIQSIRDVKPTSAFHEKQLAQIISHLESDISANLQLVSVPASMDPEGVEHQSQLLPPRAADKPAGLTFALCLQYPVARGSIHIESSGTQLFNTYLDPLTNHFRSLQIPPYQPQLWRPRRRHLPTSGIPPLERQSSREQEPEALIDPSRSARSLCQSARSGRCTTVCARSHCRRISHLRLRCDG
jgi:choline dehydrogenase-like flavoprotein